MAETTAQKQAREEKEQALRDSLRAELKAELEAEHQKELEDARSKAAEDARFKAEANARTVASQTATTVPEPDEEVPGSVTIHVVEDGLTALGKVWYRGEEFTVAPGSQNWELLTDKTTGKMLFSLTEREQVLRWGKRHFAAGPWPYGGFDLEDPDLTEKDRETLRAIQSKKALRSGGRR